MSKTVSRRLVLGAMVVIILTLVWANPFGMGLWQTLSAWADSGTSHQVRNTHFGTSGGNVKDISTIYCCSGTLGALVEDANHTQYILSNNHVLAKSDSAAVGDDVSQPGLIDNQCRIPTVVADLKAWPKLGANVDAAIATLRSGGMDATGFIEDIGTISKNVLAPSVGRAVKKSGRTTGLTRGTITSINTSVNVQYQQRCGVGKKFTVSYKNQVVISPGTFSAGGDSGSLIVNDYATNPQPVALLYAGSSSFTVGNPIGEVLTKVSSSLGSNVTFVGTNDINPLSTITSAGSTQTQASPRSIRDAHAAKDRYVDALLASPGVIGVGVGATEDESRPAVVLYIDASAPGRPPFVPAQLDGVPVRVVFTDAFVSR